jgi:phosphatidylserine/phosphatidylglycerophosphate/cardiolipin synthase-like enzyme
VDWLSSAAKGCQGVALHLTKLRLALLLLVALAGASVTGRIDVCFSPNGGCRDAILCRIRSADSTLDAAIYTFTSPEIAAALDSAAVRGVRVRVVLDPGQAMSQYSVAQCSVYKFPRRFGGGSGIMHDKFAVIDHSLTITGSFNWTEAAEVRNDENLLLISSPQLADTFSERFKFLWTHASSTLNRSVASQPAPSVPPHGENAEIVYITKSDTNYHRAGCGSLSKSCNPISRKDAEARGYTPCSRCNP